MISNSFFNSHEVASYILQIRNRAYLKHTTRRIISPIKTPFDKEQTEINPYAVYTFILWPDSMIQWFNVLFEKAWQCCMWFSKHYSENGRIADCNKNISSHLRSLNASEQIQISESTLILFRSRVFISPVLITTFKICQVHRDSFGNLVPSSANIQLMKIPKKLTGACHTLRHWKYYWCGRWQLSFLQYYDTHFEI